MSQFYGTVSGQARTNAIRRGSKNSGITTYTAGWNGAIRCSTYVKDEVDYVRVELTSWQNSGGHTKLIYDDPLDANIKFIAPASTL